MPDIPDRIKDPKGFARYAASVMQACANGADIEYSLINHNVVARLEGPSVPWDWATFDYRIAKPNARRWYTDEELMHLVHDWPAQFLVRRTGEHLSFTARICIELALYIYVDGCHSLARDNYSGLEVSLDGGRTWQPLGVEE